MPLMKTTRYPFVIDRTDDGAIVAMNYDGFVRARPMPLDGLEALIDGCQQIREKVVAALRDDAAFLARLPAYPDCIAVAECQGFHGMCNLSVVASKVEGKSEFSAAFYDLDDAEAPALLLVDEQIADFIDRAKAALA